MESRRQLKVASLIREAFGEILSREAKSLTGRAFVTITNVRVTSDLLLARFNLSIFNSEQPDEVVAAFTAHKYDIKRWLGERLHHQLRRMPELEFYRDETLDYVFHMDDVFKKIKEEDQQIAKDAERLKKAAAKKPAKRATKKPK